MKNKKIILAIVGIALLIVITIGLTYAYWQITKTQTGENKITSACLDITLEGKDDISLTNQYPLSDSEGASLTPYTFIVTNNCDTEVDYQIALESIGDSTTSISQGAIKVMLDSNAATLLSTNETVTTTITGAYASHKLGMGTLSAKGEEGSSATHTLRLWIDEAAPVSENNKTYIGKISVTIGQGIVAEQEPIKEGSLAYALLNAYGGKDNITELDSNSLSDYTLSGLFKAVDDYGDSYYYRGNVTTNYVKFANYYWRVVRVNGDGTIRMIYDGTSRVANGVSSDSLIDNSAFSNASGVLASGYMHGTESDPYGDNDSTTLTDSTIKDVVDAWYESNLKTNYALYIADSIFCNDREISEDNGDEVTYSSIRALTCTNKRDRFTVDDEVLGNGHLTNPVGLISAGEVRMSGMAQATSIENHYLLATDIESGDAISFWTMTPYRYTDSDGMSIHFVDGLGEQLNSSFDQTAEGSSGVRPVINLKADVEFTIDSDGTYVITTN